MSMDKSAIEQIQKSLVAEVLNRSVDITDAQAPIIAMPADFEVHNLERYYPTRARFRGRFITQSIDDFVRYTHNDGGHCFIDAEKMRAISIMDLGTPDAPGHAEHVAGLSLAITAPFRALQSIDGNPKPQSGIAEWLEDWRDHLRAEGKDGEEIDIKKAIGAVRKITITAARESEHTEESLSQSRSLMESIEAKSKDTDLPAFFYFHCIPYEGLQERKFMLRLSVVTVGNAISLVLRTARREAIQEEMANEFKELLLDKFDTGAVDVYIGTFQTK